MYSLIAFVALSVLATVREAGAVCASGQMAIGWEEAGYDWGESWQEVYSGFLMTNNCQLISQNGQTEDPNQMCKGGYYGGANVYCSGDRTPSQAVDTQGNWWNCWETNDSSCNEDDGLDGFLVVACCSRA